MKIKQLRMWLCKGVSSAQDCVQKESRLFSVNSSKCVKELLKSIMTNW